MKKHIFFLILALFAGMNVSWAQDYDFRAYCSSGQRLCYKITNSNEVTLVCTDSVCVGEFSIPEMVEYQGAIYSVTAIGENAFARCSELTGSLIIPNSIVTIGDYAFQECSGFTGSLIIGNSVTTIGKWAFWGCYGFSGELTLGNSVNKIGEQAFQDCKGFTGSLKIPNSVTEIGGYAFGWCEGFNGSLILGKSMSGFGLYSFWFCNGFSSIVVLASDPPEIDSDTFSASRFDNTIPVYVPCESSVVYSQAAGWDYFDNYQEIRPCDISLFSSDVTMGSVAYVQLPDCETGMCKVLATPLEGYKFDYWMENGAQVSTDAEYSFVATADRTLTAYFSETLNVNSFFDTDMQLFPNPTCGIINVQCDGMKHIAVMNALGQVVYETEPTDAQSAQIDLSGYGSGVYVVRFVTENGLINRQVIVTEQ